MPTPPSAPGKKRQTLGDDLTVAPLDGAAVFVVLLGDQHHCYINKTKPQCRKDRGDGDEQNASKHTDSSNVYNPPLNTHLVFFFFLSPQSYGTKKSMNLG